MGFLVIGTNYKYSPVVLRERISFSRRALMDGLGFLKQTRVLKGAVIVSTCNRMEIYVSTDTHGSGICEIVDFISRYHEIRGKDFYSYLYIYKELDAVRHLFRVSSGLDSQILGELQILGQVRSAFSGSEKAGFVDGLLNEVFYSAISITRRIHAETKISEGKISIGSVAIDFIKERIGPLRDKKVLIIGVGKVTELVLKYLKNEAQNVVFVANRTFEKAKLLAGRIGAEAVRFDNLAQFLGKADIVITATRSPNFIINRENIEAAFSYQLSAVSKRRLLIVDLALPRDVDPRVKEVEGVDLFGLEDLGERIDRNREKKGLEACNAEKIIDAEIEKVWERVLGLEQGQVHLR